MNENAIIVYTLFANIWWKGAQFRFEITISIAVSTCRNPRLIAVLLLDELSSFCFEMVSRLPGLITISRRGEPRSSARD